jgi:short-subunit dehydrogenase
VNHIYGAAKSGFTTYLEGLAQRVSRHGVKVKIAKLGFVASRMTRGQSMPRVLVTTPEHVARQLVWFLHSRFQSAYLPRRWWPVMTVVRHLPAFLFNRTRF